MKEKILRFGVFLLVWQMVAVVWAGQPGLAGENYPLPVIRSRQMDIHYQVNITPERLSRVELWYRLGSEKNWRLAGYDPDKVSPIRFTAGGGGVHQFLVVALDLEGRYSYKGDTAGEGATEALSAQQAIFVDYTQANPNPTGQTVKAIPPGQTTGVISSERASGGHGRPDETHFRQSRQPEPRSDTTSLNRQAENYLLRGGLYQQRAEWDKAAQAYRTALAHDANHLEARLQLGEVLYKVNKFSQAREQFELCLRRQSGHKAALYGLARSQIAMKQYGQAKVTLETLLSRDSRNGEGWLLHGDAAHKLGQSKTALSSWQRAAKSDWPYIVRIAQERMNMYSY